MADTEKITVLPSWLDDQGLSGEDIALYERAARRCGLEVGHWMRQALGAAARAVLDPES